MPEELELPFEKKRATWPLWLDAFVKQGHLASLSGEGAALATLLVLATSINKETDDCFPGIDKIAKLAGLHPSTVANSVKKLAAKGYITRRRQWCQPTRTQLGDLTNIAPTRLSPTGDNRSEAIIAHRRVRTSPTGGAEHRPQANLTRQVNQTSINQRALRATTTTETTDRLGTTGEGGNVVVVRAPSIDWNRDIGGGRTYWNWWLKIMSETRIEAIWKLHPRRRKRPETEKEIRKAIRRIQARKECPQDCSCRSGNVACPHSSGRVLMLAADLAIEFNANPSLQVDYSDVWFSRVAREGT